MLEYSMTVMLLTEYNLEFLSLKGGCTGSSDSTVVKMPHCWKSHVAAHRICINMHMQLFSSIETSILACSYIVFAGSEGSLTQGS